MICLYWGWGQGAQGVHLTKGQPDLSSTKPGYEMSLLGGWGIRGFWVGALVHLTKGQPAHSSTKPGQPDLM